MIIRHRLQKSTQLSPKSISVQAIESFAGSTYLVITECICMQDTSFGVEHHFYRNMNIPLDTL